MSARRVEALRALDGLDPEDLAAVAREAMRLWLLVDRPAGWERLDEQEAAWMVSTAEGVRRYVAMAR